MSNVFHIQNCRIIFQIFKILSSPIPFRFFLHFSACQYTFDICICTVLWTYFFVAECCEFGHKFFIFIIGYFLSWFLGDHIFERHLKHLFRLFDVDWNLQIFSFLILAHPIALCNSVTALLTPLFPMLIPPSALSIALSPPNTISE